MNSFANLRARIERSESERGAILVMSAIVMLLLLFIAAFATDLGAWYRQGEEQQRAADVGSLNGVAAFDRATKVYFDSQGVATWGDLTTATQLSDAEEAGFVESVNTVQALLETSGLSFSGTPTLVFATDPVPTGDGNTTPTGLTSDHLDADSTSTATLVADDGSIVTIRRTFIQNGFAADGVTPVFSRVIDVNVQRSGEQFFSDIIRDAPTIDRSAQALLSNCGAECNRLVEINPPFIGFDGSGNGDGYAPLPLSTDPNRPGFEEVWAINHHSKADGSSNSGQVICQQVTDDAATNGSSCPGGPYPLDYQTGNRPVEYLDGNGKIYYSARDRGSDRTGVACFDTATRSNCATPFVGLFDQNTDPSYPGWINIHGPFEYQGRLYVFSQDGQSACVNLNLTPCGAAIADLPGVSGDARFPDLEDSTFYITNGEQRNEFLYLTQNVPTGVIFHCLNLSNGSGAIGSCGTPIFNGSLSNGGDDNLTFFRHDTAGNPTGICVLHIQTGNNHCVNINGWGDSTGVANLGSDLGLLSSGNWGGDAFTWNGQRTFFAGGNSDYVACWDWTTQAACTDGPDGGGAYLLADANFTQTVRANPYGFAQVSDRCILGLGHRAVFFSFDPVGLGACADATISTQILPCECQDGSGNRFGEVRLPPELLALVNQLEGTVSLTENGGPLVDNNGTTLHYPDLVANGGVIDLTNVDQGLPFLWLQLNVDARLGGDGRPVWDSPVTANLQIDVQPTLTQ